MESLSIKLTHYPDFKKLDILLPIVYKYIITYLRRMFGENRG